MNIWRLNFFVLAPFVSTASHLKTIKRVKHKFCTPLATLTKKLKNKKVFLFASTGSNLPVPLFYANLTMSQFLFYWVSDQLEIIKHRDDAIPFMRSDKDWLMVFGCALYIIAYQNRQSIAFADNAYWVHP